MLERTLSKNFVDALMELPVTETYKGRSSLLNGLPSVSLNRSEDLRRLDLNLLVDQLDKLGRSKSTGIRPLIVVAENALGYVAEWDSDLVTKLKDIMRELDHYYGGEIAAESPLQLGPEALVFDGRDERVPLTFLEAAIRSARSVARLRVPRIFQGEPDGSGSFGTGWMITPDLLITNHHVIESRDVLRAELPASAADFQMQAEQAIVWFDYQRENGTYLECRGAELVCSDRQLDYALVRLKEANKIASRSPLPLIRRQPRLQRGMRLNIVQHARGGPLLYAIRNNFYVGAGGTENFLRYLTDTEPGSSGSPVFEDSWFVVALHRASTIVSPQTYDMQMRGMSERNIVHYNNEGTAIHAILDHLPYEVRQEISRAQGW